MEWWATLRFAHPFLTQVCFLSLLFFSMIVSEGNTQGISQPSRFVDVGQTLVRATTASLLLLQRNTEGWASCTAWGKKKKKQRMSSSTSAPVALLLRLDTTHRLHVHLFFFSDASFCKLCNTTVCILCACLARDQPSNAYQFDFNFCKTTNFRKFRSKSAESNTLLRFFTQCVDWEQRVIFDT